MPFQQFVTAKTEFGVKYIRLIWLKHRHLRTV